MSPHSSCGVMSRCDRPIWNSDTNNHVWFCFLLKYPFIAGFACTLHTEDQRDTMRLPVTKRWRSHYILIRSVDVQCLWHLKAAWDMEVAGLCTCSAQPWLWNILYITPKIKCPTPYDLQLLSHCCCELSSSQWGKKVHTCLCSFTVSPFISALTL